MDTSNGRPTQGVSGAVGDWRAPLQRELIVNKILDTLKKNLPFSRHERLQELKKIAERVEREIYTAATTQSEYTRKICLNMLTMETRLQSSMSDPMLSKSAEISVTVNPSVPFDSTANGGDWQHEVYQKIKTMKDLYLLESGDWRAQLQAESRQRIVNKIMVTLKKHLPYSGQEGLQELKKIALRFEKRIYTDATSQSDYFRKITWKMLTMEIGSQNNAASGVNPQI